MIPQISGVNCKCHAFQSTSFLWEIFNSQSWWVWKFWSARGSENRTLSRTKPISGYIKRNSSATSCSRRFLSQQNERWLDGRTTRKLKYVRRRWKQSRTRSKTTHPIILVKDQSWSVMVIKKFSNTNPSNPILLATLSNCTLSKT